jgi:hypothetical protein
MVLNKGSYHPKDKYTTHIAKNNMTEINNMLYYHEPFNDTVFSIDTQGNLYCDFILNFGKYQLPKELLLKENEDKKASAWGNDYYAMFVGNFIPAQDFLYFSFSMKGYLYQAIYAFQSKKIVCGKFVNDDLYHCFTLGNIMTGTENTLIGYLDAYYFKEVYSTMSKKDWLEKTQNPSLVSFLEGINEEDNPVIVFYELNENE